MTAPDDLAPDIAIVGAGCRFPGAPDLAAFWRNLRAGADTISRFAPEQLVAAGVPAGLVRDPAYVPARGVLVGGEEFDARFFGYNPAEAAGIDPQQRVFLEVCWAAFNDAGIDPARFAGWIGVFAGCDVGVPVLDPDGPDVMGQIIGSEKDFLATRVAYKLGLRGPAMTVQTACSTSLVAMHQACRSLLDHECDAALAGGVSLWLPQVSGYLHQEGHILSSDGRCRSFDADASGTVSSNGVGVVVLRRLADAVADGDRVMAVVRGSALNNDGAEKIGFTAPSPVGQRDVIRLSLARAGVDPVDLVHVEAHGTATQIGDPVEVAALTAAFRHTTDRVGGCGLSSVKSNIGHTGAAAGVAGVIKTALLLEHRTLVPSVHFRKPNPMLELDSSPFRVVTATAPIPEGRFALAGVSSFGIGGTNAHAVLEGPPRSTAGRGPAVFCLSAPSAGALRRARTALADRLDGEDAPEPAAVAWTLLSGRPALAHRTSVVAEDVRAACAELRGDGAGRAVAGEPTVAFVLPGQGALFPGATDAAHELLPVFRSVFDEAAEIVRRRWNVDLPAALRTGERIRESLVQQVGLFAIGYGLGRQLLDWGIRPAAMLGHSAGEYAATALAGVWDLSDGLELVAERTLAMRLGPPGGMLAVYAPEAEVGPLATGRGLAVATEGPGQVVVAGPAGAVAALAADLKRRGVPTALLDADRPFHTEHMRPAVTNLRAALTRIRSGTPDLPVVSNLTGRMHDPGQADDPDYWADHLCRPVRLAAGMASLLDAGCDLAVELGPGRTMTGGLLRHPGWTGAHTAVALLGRSSEPRSSTLLSALGRLWEAGLPTDWEALFTPRPTRCSLPPMPLDPRPLAPRRSVSGPSPGRQLADGIRIIVVGEDPNRTAELAEELMADGVRVTGTLASGPERSEPPPSVTDADWPRERRAGLSGRADLTAALRAYATVLAGRFVLDATGGGGSRSLLVEKIDPGARLPRMAGFLVDLLADQGWLVASGDELVPAPDVADRMQAATAAARGLDEVAGLRQLVERCVRAYPDIFAGRVEAVSVLYPDGDDAELNACLANNDVPVGDDGPCLDALARTLAAWHGLDRPLRVLEVGAGRGRMTSRLLEAWAGRRSMAYHVTDVSPFLVSRLRRLAAPDGPVLTARTFDLGSDPVDQGLVPGSYDLVVGYNGVHVARSIPSALTNLGRLLRPDGALCLVEVVRAEPWTHLVWGLAPGWWDTEDEVRSGFPHLDVTGWTGALAAAGFDCEVAVPSEFADHVVLVADLAGPTRPAQAEIARQAAPSRPEDEAARRALATPSEAASGATAEPGPDAVHAAVRAQWCAVLGVPSASSLDDFHELGGDSLGLVHLLGRVRETTGVQVPLPEFAADSTFGALVRRVQAATIDRPPAPVTLLRLHDGDLSPLFLTPPGAGSTLCYQHLAPLLGERQPVYGLESPGLHDGAAPASSIEQVARESLQVLQEVQPAGPYRLGGWSVGAVVAHEMATQLLARGEQVEPLLCIDGFVPRTWGFPIGARPDYLARGLRYQLQTFRPSGHAQNLGAALRLAGLVGDDRRITALGPEYVRVYTANIRAMLRYVPRPVACAAVVFKTGLTARVRRRLQRELAGTYRLGAQVHGVAGDHWSVLDRDRAGALATQIRAVLEKRRLE